MRKTIALFVVLCVAAGMASALPTPQVNQGTLIVPPMLDTFDDTIYYDDNQPYWWYGGLNNYHLATRFTPLADFEFQELMVAFTQSPGNITVWLKDDNAGQPGTILWGPTVMNISSVGTWVPLIVDTLGTYTFTAGTDFWIELSSAGPPTAPAETFDQSPVTPQRSYLDFTGTGTWYPAPGDNFIRAVGEYVGAAYDVGVDSVWHGENFFVTNGSSFQVSATVRNYSEDNPASFAVGCHIYTEIDETTYVFFDSLEIHNIMLAPGASTTVTFDPYTWSTDDRYRIDVNAYYADDVNLDNNTLSTETQVYTPPPPNVELRYDDTVPDGAAYTSAVGDGWGMKFDPQMGTEYSIAQISVNVSAGTGDLAARVQVLDDNAGVPGNVIWETVQVMANDWNDFTVNVNNTGAFYIIYIFENGASTSALSMDGYPTSGQAWDYSPTTGFMPDPTASDWAMRATLGEAGSYPNFIVNLTYVSGSPVPAGGGNVYFDVYLENASGSAQDFDAWLATEYEGGAPTTLVLRSFTNYQAGWAINRPNMYYPIPGSWAAGNYEMFARCGSEPSIVWAEDSFPFTKSGVSDGSAFQPYPVAGAPNPFDQITTADGVIVSEFALNGAYPNPFNPTTTISYNLDAGQRVTLRVYDISGREVATLVDGYRNAGVHEAVFDASGLASGIYITKLTAGNQTATAKLVLMK